MRKYELTFLWPNGNSTWREQRARDWHEAMLLALLACPATCRVQSILVIPEDKNQHIVALPAIDAVYTSGLPS